MQVLRGLDALPLPQEPAVVTVGMFDGVHRGHQAVVGRSVEVARERGVRTVAVTFDRHPREILTPGNEPPLLTTLERKIELVGELGVDVILVLEFTEQFSHVTAEEFVQRVLADGLHAVHAVIGTNFTFGHKARGNLAFLSEHGPQRGFTVEGVELIELDGRRVSSSSVREAIAAGDLEWPRTALGRRYAVDGVVVRGAGRGAGLGYPTANLETIPRLLLPAEGVYAGKASVASGEFVAAINVGSNPTFGDEPVHVEAFLLDFEGSIVGDAMTVEFWERLRDEEKFDSIEALMLQIAEDVQCTAEVVR